MSEKTEAETFDPTILTTHDIICLATIGSKNIEYGNFVRSQKNNKVIYTFNYKYSNSDTLPNIQYVIFPDQETKSQDKQWVIAFSGDDNQIDDLLPIKNLLDILDAEYTQHRDVVSDTHIIDILTVKTRVIESLAAVISLYNAAPEVQMSLIVALKEMVKWESHEIIDMINTKVAGWFALAENALLQKNTLSLLALPNKSAIHQESKVPSTYFDEVNICEHELLPLGDDTPREYSSVLFYNLISSDLPQLESQSNESFVLRNKLKIVNEYTIICNDNVLIDPTSFLEGKDFQLYLMIEKLIVDRRTQEMLTKYTLEQLKHILAAKIYDKCHTDIPKFAPEKKEYLEKFNKYIQSVNSEGSGYWKNGFSQATKHIKIWFGVGSSIYDAGAVLSLISGSQESYIFLKCSKVVVSSLQAISLVAGSESPVNNIPKDSILKEVACKISLCNLAANEDLNDYSLEQVAKFLSSFVNKYFVKNNVLFTNQTDMSQLMLEQLSNQTLLSNIGMDKSLTTVLKTVSGEDVPLLQMVTYEATECQNYIANSLTGLSNLFESASVDLGESL